MKLYAVMHKHYKTDGHNMVHWLGMSPEDGFKVFVRRKDANKIAKQSKYYRVVAFETTDMGVDARKAETWK